MSERRTLIQGLKNTPPPIDPNREKDFVFAAKKPEGGEGAPPKSTPPVKKSTTAKAPISTRIRADLASALKRASLERQLSGVEPNTLQDILEEAVEPWLRSNGYLS